MLALFLIAPVGVLAQSKVGTTAAPFLTIGVGARPLAMGGAYVAMSEDIHSLYWNPAGLARMERNEVLLVHSTWIADMNYEYVGAAFNMGRMGTAGVSASMLNVGEMEVTTVDQQEGTGLMFNSYSMAVGFSYGYQFYDRFSLGATGKYIREVIWENSAAGFAFDLGTLFITPLWDWRLGMNITNFGTPMQMDGDNLLFYYDPDPTKEGNNDRILAKYDTDNWKLPLTLRFGMAGELFQQGDNRVSLATDWVVPNDNNEHYNIGLEYAFKEAVFLRGGVKKLEPAMGDGFRLLKEDNGGGLTFGAGLHVVPVRGVTMVVNYAFESFDRLGNVHKYSLSFRL
jgi:hypothetical protein